MVVTMYFSEFVKYCLSVNGDDSYAAGEGGVVELFRLPELLAPCFSSV